MTTQRACDEPAGGGERGGACREPEASSKLRHELRTPLNQIIGYAQLLQEEARDSGQESFVPDLRKIEAAGQRLVQLVDRLVAELAAPERRPPSAPSGEHSSGSPAPVVKAAVAGSPRPVESGTPQAPSLLVVDDNEMNRDMLARRLTQRGYRVETAPGGREALERVAACPPALVLLDVMMPEVGGLEVLERLRREHAMADLPVIMVTARDASADVVEALTRGANDYVTKPIDFAVALARIETQLALKQARDEAHKLNRKLLEAQDKIAKLVDSSRQAMHDVSSWCKAMAADAAEVVGADEVLAWSYEGERWQLLCGAGGEPPAMADVREAARQGRHVRRGSLRVLPVVDSAGAAAGAIVVRGEAVDWSELGRRLVWSFARELGAAIEFRRMRRELDEAERKRRLTCQEMLERGVDFLQICPHCGCCYDQNSQVCGLDGWKLEVPRPFPFRIGGRHQLVRVLGEGGMGMVFLARDLRLDREVAVKVIRSEFLNNDIVRHRFEREARSIARVDHPGVVGVHDSGELDDGSFFIVMERLVGCDLAVLVRRRGPGTPAQVASLLRQGGAALSAAHRARLVHRDVKPENIFLTTETHGFRVKMLDFGLAIEAVTDTRLTQAGLLVGTPMFMSPEQILGHPVDHRSDIYSFASVAFLALTGRRTTTESELAGIMLELVRGSPPAVSSVLPWVPPEIDEAFVRALARAPEDRPDDAEAWVGTFASVLEGLEPHGAGWPLGQALADIGSDLKRRDDAGAVTVARRD